MNKANDNRVKRQIVYAIANKDGVIINLNDIYPTKMAAQDELDHIQINGNIKYADYIVKPFFLYPIPDYMIPKETPIHCSVSGNDYIMLSRADD